jgi:hypothetical protein
MRNINDTPLATILKRMTKENVDPYPLVNHGLIFYVNRVTDGRLCYACALCAKSFISDDDNIDDIQIVKHKKKCCLYDRIDDIIQYEKDLLKSLEGIKKNRANKDKRTEIYELLGVCGSVIYDYDNIRRV